MQFSPPGGNGTVFAPSDVVAERVGFEPTVPLPVHLISSVVRLWQIHLWIRSFQAAL